MIWVMIDLLLGVWLVVIGVSGVGKMMLLMMLVGLLLLVYGWVLLDGINLSDFDEDELCSVVSFFVEDVYIFVIIVWDNLLIV